MPRARRFRSIAVSFILYSVMAKSKKHGTEVFPNEALPSSVSLAK